MDRKVYYYNYVDDAIAMCKKINYFSHASMISGKGKLCIDDDKKMTNNFLKFSSPFPPLVSSVRFQG